MTELSVFGADTISNAAMSADVIIVHSWLQAAFHDPDRYHGVDHAETVANHVNQITECMMAPLPLLDTYCVTIAALLHDIGYAAFTPAWSPDRREHVIASLDFARAHLPQLQICHDYPTSSDVIAYLIAHHDDTNFSFPSRAWQGRVEPLQLKQHSGYLDTVVAAWTTAQLQAAQLLLAILSEADALAATGSQGAQRTFGYSMTRGIPLAATGNPLHAWCWEEGALGNIRIGAKRARIDAYTQAGKEAAISEYAASEQCIAALCQEHGLPYAPELPLLPLPLAQASIVPPLQIIAYQGWPALAAALRSITLLGDNTLLPYATAQLTVRRMPLAILKPIATYALAAQLAHQRHFYAQLATKYALNLFDLTGLMTYQYGEQAYTLAPPVIETYREPTTGQLTSVILDGLHRILLARELVMDAIWVVEATNVPEHMPVVAVPVPWSTVTLMTTVPPIHAKRRFRFDTAAALAAVMQPYSNVPVTEANYRYFLYRDLAVLGSAGIRSTAMDK